MNAVAGDIQLGQDTFVPAFEVYLDKGRAGLEVLADVLSVSYHDDLEQIDSFELTINNWNTEKPGFKYSDGDTFLPGRTLELWMGYRSGLGLQRMIRGVITGLTPSFPASGAPTLAVSGQNILHELRGERGAHRYHGRRDSEVAQEIAGRLGVRLEIDTNALGREIELRELVQENEFDIVFLMRRARRLGYELVVDEGRDGETVLRLVPSADLGRADYTLGYVVSKKNRVLIEFNPTFSTARQASRVRVQGYDRQRQESINAEVNRDEVDLLDPPEHAAAIRRSVGQRTEVVSNLPFQDAAEARHHARELMTRIKQGLCEARGRTIGLPDLRAGSVLRIEGVGSRFSGRYVVTGTDHQIGAGGYTTDFRCRREEVRGRT